MLYDMWYVIYDIWCMIYHIYIYDMDSILWMPTSQQRDKQVRVSMKTLVWLKLVQFPSSTSQIVENSWLVKSYFSLKNIFWLFFLASYDWIVLEKRIREKYFLRREKWGRRKNIISVFSLSQGCWSAPKLAAVWTRENRKDKTGTNQNNDLDKRKQER